jgi:hypothetical protein
MRSASIPLALLVLASLAACAKSAAPPPAPRTTYGRVTEGPTRTPAEILAGIDRYDGKTVRVAGTVADVCQKRGCWLDVAGDGGDTIRLKVKDGEVVFPASIKGKKVIAEGVVVKIPADPAEDGGACGAGEEHEEGHAACGRPAGARARLDGTGAVVIDAT